MPPKAVHQSLTALVHGPPKVGKSMLAASIPPPRLYLDAEFGAQHLPVRAVEWDPMDPPPVADGTWDTAVVSLRKWKDATDVLEWLQSNAHPFKSVAVDSISELQERNIEALAGRKKVEWDAWGQSLREVSGFCRDLRDLVRHPTHPMTAVVVIAMSREVNGKIGPYLRGQMKDRIGYLFDLNLYIDVEEEEDPVSGQLVTIRSLYSQRFGKIEAGERVGGRIDARLTLPEVSGSTIEEIARKNKTIPWLIKAVYSHTKPLIEKNPSRPAPPVAEPQLEGVPQ